MEPRILLCVLSSLSYLSLGMELDKTHLLHRREIKSGQRPGNGALSTLAAMRIGQHHSQLLTPHHLAGGQCERPGWSLNTVTFGVHTLSPFNAA